MDGVITVNIRYSECILQSFIKIFLLNSVMHQINVQINAILKISSNQFNVRNQVVNQINRWTNRF